MHKVAGNKCIAIGKGAEASGFHSKAFGPGAKALGDESLAIGPEAVATKDGEVVITVEDWPSFMREMMDMISEGLRAEQREYLNK